jgi:site-specific DNA recombinase
LVASGGVLAVLAQDRDRFAREPAYLWVLRVELGKHGCKLRALNDHGDDSPEGMLTDGILDQLAKYERAKVAERTRRGLLQKAREGKVIKGPKANFGFRFNETDDGLVVYEPEMRIVEKIFSMAASGMGPKAMQTRLYAEGIPSPTGKAMWPHRILKVQMVLNDLYKPHTYGEIAPLLSPEVAAGLDPNESCGIWWNNRRNVTKSYDSETDGAQGKRYVTRTSVRTRDEKDWIAVPVPAYLPRKLVNQVPLMIESRTGLEREHQARQWELKGVLRCSCGQNMITNSSRYKGKAYHYYRCKRASAYGPDACPQRMIRIDWVEPLLRDFVFGVLSDPDTIQRGLDSLIQRETEELRDDFGLEVKTLAERLSQNTQLRRDYQDQQAEGLMTLEELAARLEELEDTRKALEAELASLERSQQKAEELEKDRDTVVASLAASIPEALDNLSSEEINTVYRKLRLRLVPSEEGYDATGVLCTLEPRPPGQREHENRGYGGLASAYQRLYAAYLLTMRMQRLLLHHTQGVEGEPGFGDLSFPYQPDAQGCPIYEIAGGRKAHKHALVCAPGGPACDHLVSRRELVFQADLQVGEGVHERHDDALYTLGSSRSPGRSGSWRLKSEVKSSPTTSSLRRS